MKTGELVRARNALDEGRLDKALDQLRVARRVAVAQRKLDELLEVRELTASLVAKSSGGIEQAGQALSRQVEDDLHGFPPAALASAGIEPRPDPLESVLADAKLRHAAGARGPATARELARVRPALDEGEYAQALFDLGEARRVAVAQRNIDELLEVYELVQVLSARTSGRTHASSQRLTAQVEAGLRTFAEEPGA
jgi:hypothetical protein